ncbi:MAG TPA: hypothetical protein ENF17_07815 [Candidatus Aminicenantes bacterium]|nr:hypothetical protein [Candidatus Aminicenantes bacterium]
MSKISIPDRILLFLTALVSGYYVINGLEKYQGIVTLYFTIAFGILIITAIFLTIFSFEILKEPVIVVMATFIPLALSLGLIYKYLQEYHLLYLFFSMGGLLSILITRYLAPKRVATLALIIVHGISGIIIFLLPIIIYTKGISSFYFLLVGVGGGLISLGGILLSTLRFTKPILAAEKINALLPKLLFLASLGFVIGLSLE